MTEPGGNTTPAEALRSTERIFMGESRCGVPEGSRDVAAAFGKAEPGKTFDPLKSLVITDIPTGKEGKPIRTEQQIKDLSSKVQKLVEEGKISGLYLNCLSKSGQEGKAAETSIVFLEVFVDKLEHGESATKAIADLKKLGKNDTQSEIDNLLEVDGFSAVIVMDGKAHVVGFGDKAAVKIIKANGSIDTQKSGDEVELEKDSKIVLCSKDDTRLDSVKDLSAEQIVNKLNEPPVSEKEKKHVTIEKKYNTPKGQDAYEDRFFMNKDTGFVAVIDGAGGIGGGGKDAADAVWSVLATEMGGDTLQFDGKERKEVEGVLTKIAENANREIRGKTPGKAACLSTGEIYRDADGKLSFSYINHGDTEIAIVKKDGSVQLVPNHSIRHLSETDPRGIDLYLSEREAAFKLMHGQDTHKLEQEIVVGSIDIDEGDKVIFLTDGVAEDLHNIRGSVSSDGTISPQKGPDGKQIGLDILSQVKGLDAKSASSKIMDLLAEVRGIPEDKGVVITRHSSTYNSEVRRKIVQKDGLNIVVGGKGPTTDRGYDDGETVVVMEAKMTKEKAPGQAHGAAAGETKSETVQEAAKKTQPPPQEPSSPHVDQAPTLRQPPFIEDVKDDSDAVSVDNIGPRLIRRKTTIDPTTQQETTTVIDYADVVTKLTPQVSLPEGTVPAGSTATASELAKLQTLEDHVRNPGTYRTKPDSTYRLIQQYPDQEVLLMAIEAARIKIYRSENQRLVKEQDEYAKSLHRREVRKATLHSGLEISIDKRGYDSYFKPLKPGEKPRAEEIPQEDLTAFAFVAETLMDVKDASLGAGSDGQPKTYREAFKELMAKMDTERKAHPGGSPAFDAANRTLLEKRRDFYVKSMNALSWRQRDVSTPSQDKNVADDVNRQMIVRIQTLEMRLMTMQGMNDADRQAAIQNLFKDTYHGVASDPSLRTQEKVVNMLLGQSGIWLNMALKGGDLMYRRSLLDTLALNPVPDKIYSKRMVQAREVLEREGKVPKTTPDVTPTDGGTGTGTEKATPAETPTRDQLPPAPTGGTGTGEKPPHPTQGTPAEPVTEPQPSPTGEASSEIGVPDGDNQPAPVDRGRTPGLEDKKPAPVPENGKRPDKPAPAPTDKRPPGEKGNPPGGKKDGLPMSADFGIAALHDRAVQNLGEQAQNYMAVDMAKPNKTLRDKTIGAVAKFIGQKVIGKVPLIGKPVGNVIYGVVNSVLHPVQTWRNSIARGAFQVRAMRFAADIDHIVREQSGFTKGIPVDVNNNIMNAALEGGKKFRSKNIFKRLGVWASDIAVDVTGVGQNSEQRYAKKWLKEDTEAATILKTVTDQVLNEADALGARYAISREGMTTEEVNRMVLAEHAGETRILLSQSHPELNIEANNRLKGIVAEYASSAKTDKTELVKKVNEYILGGFKRGLKPEFQDQLNAPEVASNIISLAEQAKAHWNEYQAAGENGKTKWDEFQINIYLGKSEGMAKRGKVEMDFLTEKLARRLANRELSGGSKAIAEAGGIVNLIKDNLTTFGPYFAGAWATGALKAAPNMIAKAFSTAFAPAGGGAMVGVAALKETGLSIPGLKHLQFTLAGHTFSPFRQHGRFEQEVGQVSREAAIGREAAANSPIRKEIMERLLVNRKEAQKDFIDPLNQIIEKAQGGEISESEAKQLLGSLAELDARMRLSDLSGQRDLNYHDQNYIQYTEGQENQQYLALKSTLLNGLSTLSAYATTHPTFLPGTSPGDRLFTLNGITYRQAGAGASMGVFDRMSALAEAQLRYGSQNTKAMEKWLKDTLGFTDVEITDTVARMPGVNLGVDKKSSLRTKENALFGMTMRRGVEVAFTSALAMPIAGTVYRELGTLGQSLQQEGADIAAHVTQAGGVKLDFNNIQDFGKSVEVSASHVGVGMTEYGQEWGNVISGKPVLEFDAAGNLVSGLTDIQRGALTAQGVVNGVITPPFWPPQHLVLARQPIDGITIDLPPQFHHSDVNVPLPAGGFEKHEIMFNSATGDVFDMNHIQLKVEQNAAGINQLVAVDDRVPNAQIPADQFFGTAHGKVSIVEGAPVTAVNDVWKPAATTHPDNTTGHIVTIPDNTKFVPDVDPATNLPTGKWDLIAVDAAGNKVGPPVLDAAEFDATGKLVVAPGSTGIINQNQHVVPGAAAPAVAVAAPAHIIAPGGGIDPNGPWGQHDTHIDRDGWDPTNRLQAYNFKDGNALVLDTRAVASVHGHGGETGIYLTIPGHPNDGIFLKGDYIRIEEGSKVVIDGTNGMTSGQLFDMIVNKKAFGTFDSGTEFNNRRDVLNIDAWEAVEKFDGKGGAHMMVGATGLGNGQIPQVPHIPAVPPVAGPPVTINTISVAAPSITHTDITPTFEIRSTMPPDFNWYFLPVVVRNPVERSVAAGQGEKVVPKEPKKSLKERLSSKEKIAEADKILEERGKKKDKTPETKKEWSEEDQEFLKDPLATPEEMLKNMGISIPENEKFKDKDKKVKTPKFEEYEGAVEIMKQYEAAYRAGDTGAMRLQRKALSVLLSKWKLVPESDDEKKGLFKRPDREHIFDRMFTGVEGTLASRVALRKKQKEMAEAQKVADAKSTKQQEERQQEEQIRRQEEAVRAYAQQYLGYVERVAKADAGKTDPKELVKRLQIQNIEGIRRQVISTVLHEDQKVSEAHLQKYWTDVDTLKGQVDQYSKEGDVHNKVQELLKSPEFKQMLELNIQPYAKVMADSEQEALKRIEAVRNPAASSAVAAKVA